MQMRKVRKILWESGDFPNAMELDFRAQKILREWGLLPPQMGVFYEDRSTVHVLPEEEDVAECSCTVFVQEIGREPKEVYTAPHGFVGHESDSVVYAIEYHSVTFRFYT